MTWLRCSDIIINKQKVDQNKINDYADLMELSIPAKFPPIVVRISPEGPVLVDGRHRLAARKQLGREFVLARITL
jgi:hypothetical protein